MKKFLLVCVFLLACLKGYSQIYTENGVVYCKSDSLLIGRIQANFEDEMALCQFPNGYAIMLLEGNKELVNVAIGETKELAIQGMTNFIKMATTEVSKRTEYIMKNIKGEDVIITVFPAGQGNLNTKLSIFCPSTNLGSGIILLNNLNYFNKLLAKYPAVHFK